jgi:hypothetical protein
MTRDDKGFLEEIVDCQAGLILHMNHVGKFGLSIPVKNYKVHFKLVRVIVWYIWRHYGGKLHNVVTCLYIAGQT